MLSAYIIVHKHFLMICFIFRYCINKFRPLMASNSRRILTRTSAAMAVLSSSISHVKIRTESWRDSFGKNVSSLRTVFMDVIAEYAISSLVRLALAALLVRSPLQFILLTVFIQEVAVVSGKSNMAVMDEPGENTPEEELESCRSMKNSGLLELKEEILLVLVRLGDGLVDTHGLIFNRFPCLSDTIRLFFSPACVC